MKLFNFRIREKGAPYIWIHSIFADSEEEARNIILNILSNITTKPPTEFEIIECRVTED